MTEFLTVILIVFAASLVLFGILSFFIVTHIIFTMHLKRTSKEKWTRECSDSAPTQREIYEDGLAWAREVGEKKVELHMVNEGLNLYAEYFDLGNKKAVIIVPGRTEGLRYGYFFARPYAESGYNVLTIDQRAHGNSDGVYNTLGFEEHKDVIAWARRLHDDFGVEEVVLHGICIGSACSLYALISPDCPDYLVGMTAEGMYPNFYESFKNHVIELKKPTFPTMALVKMWLKLYTGHKMDLGPIDVISTLDKPLLMLHSREDAYSLPVNAERLYNACRAEGKEIVWFDHGPHSHLRRVSREKYDASIKAFLQKNFAEKSLFNE